MKKNETCIVCGEEHGLDDVHEININGESKKICKECVMAIKGLA